MRPVLILGAALLALAGAAAAITAADLHAVENASTVVLTTTGRKTGQARTVEVWFVHDDGRLYVQSGKGGTTDWYRNLTANPAVTLRIGSLTLRGRAHPIDDAGETARIHALFEQKYVRARVLSWFGGQTGHGKVVRIDDLQFEGRTVQRSAAASCQRRGRGHGVATFHRGAVGTPREEMGAKELRKKVRTLDERIREHEMKILVEAARPAPDRGLIRHWRTEIRAFRDGIRRARKRLGERR